MPHAPRRLGRKLLVSVASLVVVLGGLELVCRLAGFAPGDYFRWMASAELQVVPLPGQQTWFGKDDPAQGGLLPIRINAHSQRGEDYPLAKAPGELRVVVVGDSLTMGQGVLDDQTYPAVLGELLAAERAGVRVVNAGVNGWTSWHYMRWAQTQLERFRPDVLVIGLFLGNDADPVTAAPQAVGVPLENALRGSALYRFVVATYRKHLWKRVEAAKRGISVEELEAQLDRYRGLLASDLPPDELRRHWERHSIALLEEARDACRAAGVPVACLLIPTWGMVLEQGEPLLHAFVRGRLVELGLPTITCLDALRAAGREAWLPWDEGHLSVGGNRVVARVLAAGLEASELVR